VPATASGGTARGGLRIVGGRHRGRRIEVPPGEGVRPTSDRIREALFNVLMHQGWGPEGANPVLAATVLDVFAGSGALALEALSRGAARAFAFEQDRIAARQVQANARGLGEAGRLTLIEADALDPPPARAPANLIFLDPPYGRDLVAPALAALRRRGWIAPGAVLVVETDKAERLPPLAGAERLAEKTYGKTRLVFLRG